MKGYHLVGRKDVSISPVGIMSPEEIASHRADGQKMLSIPDTDNGWLHEWGQHLATLTDDVYWCYVDCDRDEYPYVPGRNPVNARDIVAWGEEDALPLFRSLIELHS